MSILRLKLTESVSNKTALEILEQLDYGDTINVETADGYWFVSWIDNVSFGSAWEDTLCMFIQIEDSTTYRIVAYAGKIESEREFERKKEHLINELSESER